ncbi:tail protein [Arthrobacter phage SWEP2]|uniref:Tail protein n=1 Tax=Arthrobacter phage SWEP2 TaxID=2945958 RepID=A0A9E7SH18_9CAUD|nr:tail protein [Arthrobacter phage SWEP2]
MATSAERLAAELADLRRRLVAIERGSQLGRSTFTAPDGSVMPVLTGVATGVQAKALADTLETAQAELAADAIERDARLADAEAGLTAADGRLTDAEADLVSAFGRLDTAETSLAAVPGDIDAAKQAAIDAAALDAQAKADAARDAAVLAAEADASSKAAQAEADALAQAALDAQAKADAAQQAAIDAAAITAQAKADAARDGAISAAEADATAKADAAEAAAKADAAAAQSAADAAASAASAAQADADAAATAAATAQSRADAAHALAGTAESNAQAAITAASNAQNAADNVAKNLFSTNTPAGTAPYGSTWFQVNGTGEVIGQWQQTAAGIASTWTPRPIRSEVIANLDVGKLTAGTANILTAVAQKIAAGTASFQTADVKNLFVTDTAAIDVAVANALYAKKISAGKILAGEVLIGGGENRIPWDPTTLSPHSSYNGSTITPITDADLGKVLESVNTSVTSGTPKTFFRFRSGETATNGRSGSFSVAPGENYLVQIGVGAGGSYTNGAPKVRTYVEFHGPTGTFLSAATQIGELATMSYSGDPTFAVGDIAVPAGAYSLDIYVQQDQPGRVFLHSPSLRRKTEGSLIVDGAVKAAALESDLVLASRIIAGDPDGTHAEMSPEGFRVFSADPADGIPNEVVRMGVASSDDYFAVTKADGSLAATISQDGVGSFTSVYANDELYYQGEKLSTVLGRLPRGPLYKAELSADIDNITTEYGLVEAEYIADGEDRQIELEIGIKFFPNQAGDEAYCNVRYTVDGTAPTINSPRIFDAPLGVVSSTTYDSKSYKHTIRPSTFFPNYAAGQRVRFLLSVHRGNGASLRVRGGLNTYLYVNDVGPGIPHTPSFSPGVGSNPAPPPPVPPKQTYVKQYGCTNSANYDGNGNRYTFNDSVMFQGLSPAGYGNLKSIALFGDMTGDLSGATINYVRVFFQFDHWYYNSGGTARIGVHGHTGIPGTDWGRGPLSAISSGWPKPGARWVELSSSHWDGFRTGAYRGVYLEGDGTYGTYGYAQRPVIEISYTK